MATDLDPWLKNYITDVSSQVNTRQLENPFCKRIESQLAHCMEAYGKERAPDSCKLLLLDFHECLTLRKQLLRVTVSFLGPIFVGLKNVQKVWVKNDGIK